MIHEKWQSCTVTNEEFTLQNRSTDVCLYHYRRANPVLPGKLPPTFVNQAVHTYTGFPQALEIIKNQEKSSMHGKIMKFEKT